MCACCACTKCQYVPISSLTKTCVAKSHRKNGERKNKNIPLYPPGNDQHIPPWEKIKKSSSKKSQQFLGNFWGTSVIVPWRVIPIQMTQLFVDFSIKTSSSTWCHYHDLKPSTDWYQATGPHFTVILTFWIETNDPNKKWRQNWQKFQL